MDKRGTRAAAQTYLEYLYSRQGQEIVAKNYYRPRDAEMAARYAERYPAIPMVNIRDFGGWDLAQAQYFADGGMFDRIFSPGR